MAEFSSSAHIFQNKESRSRHERLKRFK